MKNAGAQEEEEEAQHMEVSAQLHGVCIGTATALGKRPDQQVRTPLAFWCPVDEGVQAARSWSPAVCSSSAPDRSCVHTLSGAQGMNVQYGC